MIRSIHDVAVCSKTDRQNEFLDLLNIADVSSSHSRFIKLKWLTEKKWQKHFAPPTRIVWIFNCLKKNDFGFNNIFHFPKYLELETSFHFARARVEFAVQFNFRKAHFDETLFIVSFNVHSYFSIVFMRFVIVVPPNVLIFLLKLLATSRGFEEVFSISLLLYLELKSRKKSARQFWGERKMVNNQLSYSVITVHNDGWVTFYSKYILDEQPRRETLLTWFMHHFEYVLKKIQ